MTSDAARAPQGGSLRSIPDSPDAAAPGAPPFSLEMEVRDYELDVQGIVNNANYQHYLEHARHAFLKTRGLDFVALHERGMDAVVYRIEIDYKVPLRSGERFSVSVRVRTEGRMKLVFEQEIRKIGSGHLAAAALVTAAIVAGGRPVKIPPEVAVPLYD